MKKERGRPTEYTEEIAMEICRLMESGKSLREICKDEKYPHESTVRYWHICNRDGFSTHYARAREVQMDRYMDEIIEICDDISRDTIEVDGQQRMDHEHINRSRLRVDTRKWLMSKIAPKRFGDKTAVEHSGSSEVTLRWVKTEETNDAPTG